MSKYIVWPHSVDEAFRPRYAEITGESIQSSPHDDGARFMVGSSRLTEAHKTAIGGEFPEVEILDVIPQDWAE